MHNPIRAPYQIECCSIQYSKFSNIRTPLIYFLVATEAGAREGQIGFKRN